MRTAELRLSSGGGEEVAWFWRCGGQLATAMRLKAGLSLFGRGLAVIIVARACWVAKVEE